jgi:enoyl-CoA hydratase
MSSAASPSAAPEDVLVRRQDGVLIVTINRPRAYLEPVFASQDAAEGVAAFRERRDAVWQDQ